MQFVCPSHKARCILSAHVWLITPLYAHTLRESVNTVQEAVAFGNLCCCYYVGADCWMAVWSMVYVRNLRFTNVMLGPRRLWTGDL